MQTISSPRAANSGTSRRPMKPVPPSIRIDIFASSQGCQAEISPLGGGGATHPYRPDCFAALAMTASLPNRGRASMAVIIFANCAVLDGTQPQRREDHHVLVE